MCVYYPIGLNNLHAQLIYIFIKQDSNINHRTLLRLFERDHSTPLLRAGGLRINRNRSVYTRCLTPGRMQNEGKERGCSCSQHRPRNVWYSYTRTSFHLRALHLTKSFIEELIRILWINRHTVHVWSEYLLMDHPAECRVYNFPLLNTHCQTWLLGINAPCVYLWSDVRVVEWNLL